MGVIGNIIDATVNLYDILRPGKSKKQYEEKKIEVKDDELDKYKYLFGQSPFTGNRKSDIKTAQKIRKTNENLER